MIRNLKALGLAFVAVFAMSAVAATAAQAAEEFHSHAEETVLTGHATGVLHFTTRPEGVRLVCNYATFEGVQNGTNSEDGTYTSPTATVYPQYFSTNASDEKVPCDGLGGSENVTVRSNMCHYVFHAETDEAGMAQIDLVCENEGEAIESEVAGVVIDIPPQELPSGVHYNNLNTAETNEKHIEVETTATGIHWVCTASAFICNIGFGGTEGSEGTYNGTVTVQGFTGEGDETTTDGYEHGEQVGIWKE
jgi:hypothetical protein